MRITGGDARGRKLAAPRGRQEGGIRPTSDRVRESLFNLIGARVQGARILDCFAGTGALGIEALSRGASFALFVDFSLEAGRLIEANLRSCFAACRPDCQAAFACLDLSRVSAASLARAVLEKAAGCPFDLVFMDPPYEKKLAEPLLMMVETSTMLTPDALVVVEERRNAGLPVSSGTLVLTDRRCYGETGLWFYQRQA